MNPKDLRFGMGMSAMHVSTPDRRDRLWLINAFAVVLLTLLGTAGEALNTASPSSLSFAGYSAAGMPSRSSDALTAGSSIIGPAISLLATYLVRVLMLSRPA